MGINIKFPVSYYGVFAELIYGKRGCSFGRIIRSCLDQLAGISRNNILLEKDLSPVVLCISLENLSFGIGCLAHAGTRSYAFPKIYGLSGLLCFPVDDGCISKCKFLAAPIAGIINRADVFAG